MIAIHNGKGGFHPYWINYCKERGIQFKIVDCFSNNITSQLKDCKALMWHHSQNDPKSLVAAKPILYALEHAGFKVFPNFRTNWYFDDKLGQKYLLELLGIQFVKTWVFYNKKDAIDWTKNAIFPKVFKLRGGAGSANVKLVKNARQARQCITKAFGTGFSNYDCLRNLKESIRKWRLGLTDIADLLKGFARLVVKPKYAKVIGRESGYVYFQDFIPGNEYDIRIVVIGNKAFAIKRIVRKNDFRASGSGEIRYEKNNFKEEWIKLAFKINDKIMAQCLALDYVFDNGSPKIVEISYGFDPKGYNDCPGYWDNELNWHEEKFNPYGWMIEFINNEQL